MLLNKINKVESFSILDKTLILSINQQYVEILDNNLENNQKVLIPENIQEINSENKFIWTNTSNDGKGLILQSQKFEIKPYLIKSIDSDGNMYCRLDNKGSKIDKNEKIVWQLEDKFFVFLIAINIFFYRKNKNKIIAIDNYNGNLLWNYILPEGEYSQGSNYPSAVSKEIVNILGIYGGIVWIINDIGHLIGLDSETGKCKYHLKTPVNIPIEWGNWEVFVYAKKSYIDLEKGIIFGLDHVYYWECDLNNPTESYLLHDISETSKEHSIVPDLKGNWLGDEVFFGQNSFAQDPGFVGIFNRQTHQITWTSRELGDESVFKGINKMEYQSNRLYVLDKANTLHIFEQA